MERGVIGLDSLGRDLLLFILNLAQRNNVRRNRWGLLATFRLVCKYFAHVVSVVRVRAAAKIDLSEFYTVCLFDQHFYLLHEPGGDSLESLVQMNLVPCTQGPVNCLGRIVRVPEAWMPFFVSKDVFCTLCERARKCVSAGVNHSETADIGRLWWALGPAYRTYFLATGGVAVGNDGVKRQRRARR